jgi:hypothetical protein
VNGKSGAPKGNKNAVKHGGYAMLSALQSRKIDGRSEIGVQLRKLRQAIEADLGGVENISTAQRALLDRALFKMLICEGVERWALSQPKLIKRDGTIPPVLGRVYLGWSEALRRDLQIVGLQRRAKDAGSLDALLRAAVDDDENQEGGETS